MSFRLLWRLSAAGIKSLLGCESEQLVFTTEGVSPAENSQPKLVTLLPARCDQPVLMPQPLPSQAERLLEAEQAACQLAAKLICQTALMKAVQAEQARHIQASQQHCCCSADTDMQLFVLPQLVASSNNRFYAMAVSRAYCTMCCMWCESDGLLTAGTVSSTTRYNQGAGTAVRGSGAGSAASSKPGARAE